MAMNSLDMDLKQLVLDNNSFGPRDIDQLAGEIGRDFKKYDELKDIVTELKTKDELSPSNWVKLGVCQFLLGQVNDAFASLKHGDGGALDQFYLAKVYFARHEYESAVQAYQLAQSSGYNVDYCTLGRAEVYRYQGDFTKSLAELDDLSGAIEQTAEYLYQRGATVGAIGGNPREMIALYERAIAVDKNHPGALFGLALENERRGNDEEALDYYQRAVNHFPTNVGTLMNLGLLYEDLEMYDQAILCYQRVLDSYPDNERARLFIKDARASSEMHIDEDALRKRDRMSQTLNLPVSDFELSVRSRNCLDSMGIKTLGDLCRHSEQDLLSSKNFGETSLVEIREILTMKGLRLGMCQTSEHHAVPTSGETVETEISAEEIATKARPVNDLDLSVRARKCMGRLRIETIGDLVQYSADKLLECKNFGVTSLKEIREKLVNFNIRLKGE